LAALKICHSAGPSDGTPGCAPHKKPPPPLDRQSALFLDVDGTLIEIASRPELVQVPRQLAALLDRLARQRDGALAVISGRPVADLDRLLSPWRGAAAGLHGAERRRPDGSAASSDPDPQDADAAAALQWLRPRLAELAGATPGVWLEDKGRTLALHYRAVPERGGEMRDLVARLAEEAGGRLRLIAGKMVLELQSEAYGKGRAIAAFLAEAPFRGRRAVFLGDDTTDEDGFAEVNRRGGLAIRVGAPSATTAASWTLDSVAAVLEWLAADGDA